MKMFFLMGSGVSRPSKHASSKVATAREGHTGWLNCFCPHPVPVPRPSCLQGSLDKWGQPLPWGGRTLDVTCIRDLSHSLCPRALPRSSPPLAHLNPQRFLLCRITDALAFMTLLLDYTYHSEGMKHGFVMNARSRH